MLACCEKPMNWIWNLQADNRKFMKQLLSGPLILKKIAATY
jgi:hypothetical protein